MLHLYTDGSFQPTTGRGGSAFVLRHGQHRREFAVGFFRTNLLRTELHAAVAGLEQIDKPAEVVLHADARAVLDPVQNGNLHRWRQLGWRRSVNKALAEADLWQRLARQLDRHSQVHLRWVKAHTGHPENEICDRLARLAVAGPHYQTDYGFYGDEGPDFLNAYADLPEKVRPVGWQDGDPCRNCGTVVARVASTPKQLRKKRSFRWRYVCRGCGRSYTNLVDRVNSNEEQR